jgi:hypothetical protein
MSSFSDDVFTEPSSVDPDTLANLGPLRRLAGVWEGRKGVDLNPKADGPERRDYLERIEMQPIDPQVNGPQLLYGLRYHVHIVASDEDITFHDQTGYWLWEPSTGLVVQTLAIPRGQVALASGRAAPEDDRLIVRADRGGPGYGICSTEFLEWAFRTDAYTLEVTLHPDGSWSYTSDTVLQVRGRDEPFHHVDRNRLSKVAEPVPNPLQRIGRDEGRRLAVHGFTGRRPDARVGIFPRWASLRASAKSILPTRTRYPFVVESIARPTNQRATPHKFSLGMAAFFRRPRAAWSGSNEVGPISSVL